jgi:hypothetical protein
MIHFQNRDGNRPFHNRVRIAIEKTDGAYFQGKGGIMSIKSAINNRLTGFIIFVFIAVFLMGTGTAIAQEHPGEHPSEHPSSVNTSITKESLAAAITDYVTGESELKGGYFLFFDQEQNKPLALTLDKVHKDRLSALGEGVYFACADFNDTGGDMYDLDIFMMNGMRGLEVTEISVHKKNGEARYVWVEKDGIWSRKTK